MAETAIKRPLLWLPDRLGGPLELRYLVSDFTGTISVDGEIQPGVATRIRELAGKGVKIYYMTADTHGKVNEALAGLPVVDIVKVDVGEDKPKRMRELNPNMHRTVVMGNGHNDIEMFKMARLGIAVMEGEGLAGDLLGLAIECGWPVVRSACDGLDLLLHPKRLQATLRD